MSLVLPAKPSPRIKPHNGGKRWTPEEDALLHKEWLADQTINQISDLHGRTEVSIAARLEALINVPFEDICGFEKGLVLSRKQKVEAIADLVVDYRDFELGSGFVSQERIEDWVSQFPGDLNQAVIISELLAVLNAHYWNRARVRDGLLSLLEKINSGFRHGTRKQLLQIQKRGSSQRKMVAIANRLSEEKGYEITASDIVTREFVYLDDILYSGNHFFFDLHDWITHDNLSSVSIAAGFLSVHEPYLGRQIENLSPLLKQRKIDLKVCYEKSIDAKSCLCPSRPNNSSAASEIMVRKIVEESRSTGRPAFRQVVRTNPHPMTTLASRELVERLFFDAGAIPVVAAKNPQQNMKPMGYGLDDLSGFGAYTFTYLNISNNCPLALWYGNSEAAFQELSIHHPFNRWYPLFPRRANPSLTWRVT